MNKCPKCGSENIVKYGKDRHGKQRYRCNNCRHQFSAPVEKKQKTTATCSKCGSSNLRTHEKFPHKTGYVCRDCGKYTTVYITNGQKKEPKEMTIPTKIGMSITEFRQKHDVEFIIHSVLQKLEKDIIYEKSDVLRMTGLRAGYPGLSQTLEDKKFQEYRGRAGGVTYWSHPDTINRLKEETIMV